jgi:uncharacterized delta-60 repeat protein
MVHGFRFLNTPHQPEGPSVPRSHPRWLLTACALVSTLGLVGASKAGDRDGLDPRFGTDGKVLTDLDSGSTDEAFAVVIQPDRKIVAAGWSGKPGRGMDAALARYDRDGSLDAGFGEGGTVLTNFGEASPGASSFEAIQALALQPDGKIIAAGWTDADRPDGGGFGFALMRYDVDGTLDPAFGDGGRVLTRFDPAASAIAYAVLLQADGRVVAAGESGGDFALARYNPDGSLDPSFGSGGLVLTDFGPGGFDEARAVALDAHGRIVVAGRSGFRFALARYTPKGRLDSTFGDGGRVLTDFGFPAQAFGLAIQPGGRIVAGGWADDGGYDFALARYHADGRLDRDFGSDGLVLTDIGGGTFDQAFALAARPNGSLVLAGTSNPNTPGALDHFALARYKRRGRLDRRFGEGGTAVTDFGATSSGEAAFAVAVARRGTIVAAGRSNASGDMDFAIARYVVHAAHFDR